MWPAISWWGRVCCECFWHARRQHEQMSVELLEDILGGEQSHTISRDLSDEEIKHIEAMITCEKGGQPAPSGKRWLYEVHILPSSALLLQPKGSICLWWSWM